MASALPFENNCLLNFSEIFFVPDRQIIILTKKGLANQSLEFRISDPKKSIITLVMFNNNS